MEIVLRVICVAIICELYYQLKTLFFVDGTFRVDQSNPEKNVFRIAFEVHPEELIKNRIVVLRVDSNADLSQE